LSIEDLDGAQAHMFVNYTTFYGPYSSYKEGKEGGLYEFGVYDRVKLMVKTQANT